MSFLTFLLILKEFMSITLKEKKEREKRKGEEKHLERARNVVGTEKENEGKGVEKSKREKQNKEVPWGKSPMGGLNPDPSDRQLRIVGF